MKRRRTGSNAMVVVKATRPIDKSLICVTQTVTGTAGTTTLATAAFPCTITGLRWDLCLVPGTSSAQTAYWAIIRVKDGQNLGNFLITDGSTFYEPEQELLAFGVNSVSDGDTTLDFRAHWKGSTKTKRKMMVGDTLRFVTIGTNTTSGTLRGVVQFFCQT